MSYEIVLKTFNADGSVQREEVTGHIYMPLEDAKKNFQEDIAASPNDFNPEYSGTKYRLELRDDYTDKVVDSYDGVVP